VPPLIGRWAEPAKSVLPGLVRPAWNHLRRTVQGIDNPPRAEQLHEVRIRAKRCRYAAEAVAPAIGNDAGRLAAAVARVQSVLGDHHDAFVAEAWLREAAGGADIGQVLVAGELIALQRLEATELERKWRGVWEKASRKQLRRWLD
jgi:CHAD domain-containing protein